MRTEGMDVSHAQVRYLNPFPKNFEEVLKRFDKVLIPEMNMGQLRSIVRRNSDDVIGLNKVQGVPFTKNEIRRKPKNY